MLRQRRLCRAGSFVGPLLLPAFWLAATLEPSLWEAGPGAAEYGRAGVICGALGQWEEEAQQAFDLVLDEGLVCAAQLCARWLGEHAASELPPGFLEFALRWAGCSDPTVLSLVVLTSENSPAELWRELQKLQSQSAVRHTHWGFGGGKSQQGHFRTVWVALLSERKVAVAPFPRLLQPERRVRFLAQWRGEALANPRLVLQAPDERLRELEVQIEEGAVTASLPPLRERGEYTLELLADGKYGPEVLALLTFGLGTPLPTQWVDVTKGRREAVTSLEAEQQLLELLNAERRRRALPPLALDPKLQAVAREHAVDMAKHGFFGHRSPERGDFPERFAASGWRALRAAENLSKSESIVEAHAGLMASPAHRSNILSPYFTHIGIGVALRRGDLGRSELIIAQVFALPMPGGAPAAGTR